MIRERRPVSLGEKGLVELQEFATIAHSKDCREVDAKAANLRRSETIYLPINDPKGQGLLFVSGISTE